VSGSAPTWSLTALSLALVALVALASLHGRHVRGERRRARMRAGLADVLDLAWLGGAPEDVLARARETARRVLRDPGVQAELRPLGAARFEALLAPGRGPDAEARQFLADLAHVVSVSAERHVLATQVRRQAAVDALTDLPSRGAFDELLAHVLAGASSDAWSLGVLVCDVDGLRHVNEHAGHACGDQVLAELAELLRSELGDDAVCGRIGGDELAAVVRGMRTPVELLALGRGLQDRFAAGPGRRTGTSLSVGLVSWSPRDPEDGAELLRSAELAVAEAKRSHTGVAFFDGRLRSREETRARARADLAHAVASGAVVAYFQPLTDATTLEVVGLEALARWRDGDRLRPPAEWLPLAEETGLIVEVGRQMLAAARQASDRYGLPVAVNVAPRQLDQPDFVRQVEQSWGVDGWDRLTLEVTESAVLYDAQHARDSLANLAQRGVTIALDDFGTGYNSLSRLGELPLGVLKIDRSLVQDCDSPEGVAVLRAVMAVARAHALDVVAEGVENRHELAVLVDLGVPTVQGHLLGRPAPGLPSRDGGAPTQRLSRRVRIATA
jgi:diguanylate cyclase (GGDEF)-like protein